MRLVGSHDGIGVALFEDLSIALYRDALNEIPFTPSPYCNPDIKAHRRVEKCKELNNNPDYATVGTCKHKGCNGKKFYPHRVDDFNTNIQAQNTVKYVEFERNVSKKRGHFSGGHEDL